MNRKQKIIVSVTGIFIVLLILVGLTYAYFLTRINGNTNTKSISVTTADLKLTYGDGNGIITAEKIEPGTTLDTKTFTVKNEGNASVTYGVYLDELVNTLERNADLVYTMTCESSNTSSYCNGVEDETFPKLNSLVTRNSIAPEEIQTYKLTVTYKETNTDQSVDMGKEMSALVQIYGMNDTVDLNGTVTGTSDGDYIQINSVQKTSKIVDGKYSLSGIEPGTHTLKIMNDTTIKASKTIDVMQSNTPSITKDKITFTKEDRVAEYNIKYSNNTLDITDTNIKTTLLNAMLTRAKSATIYTDRTAYLTEALDFTKTQTALMSMEDDYGTSYFYRGEVTDNYVEFNNMCWRIVRSEGDESIRLILINQYGKCSEIGDGTYDSTIDQKEHSGRAVINDYDHISKSGQTVESFMMNWYNSKLANNDNLIKNTKQCVGDETTVPFSEAIYPNKKSAGEGSNWTYSKSDLRYLNEKPILKCDGRYLNSSKVYLISNDEVQLSGANGVEWTIYSAGRKPASYSYLRDYLAVGWITTAYSSNNFLKYVNMYNNCYGSNNCSAYSIHLRFDRSSEFIRPMITLKAGTTIESGNGKMYTPYIISE